MTSQYIPGTRRVYTISFFQNFFVSFFGSFVRAFTGVFLKSTAILRPKLSSISRRTADTIAIKKGVFVSASSLPSFPNFKKLSVDDKGAIDFYTTKNKAYSTFNFTNMWAWDIRDKRMVCDLNGNLVLLSIDYETPEPFFSFLGTNKTTDTSLTLLEYAKAHNISSILHFISEEAVDDLRTSYFSIEEDMGNSDYVYSVARLADPRGVRFKEKRHLATQFLRENPNATFEQRNIVDPSVHEQVIATLHRWGSKKIIDNKPCGLEFEEKAIRRIFETANKHDLVLSCIYVDTVMAGFGIDEIIHDKTVMSHFIKADATYKGIYEFFNESLAKFLLKQGGEFWNWQEDLGMSELRASKMSYHPVEIFKKYRVSKK